LRQTYHDEEEKERAIADRNSKYYVLLETCLQNLAYIGVLAVGEVADSSDAETYRIYYRTELLRTRVCPAILREPEKLHDINSILNNR
jgi:hypothetical protein